LPTFFFFTGASITLVIRKLPHRCQTGRKAEA
jgi:hypothetical protein